jgi:hypothetical protein
LFARPELSYRLALPSDVLRPQIPLKGNRRHTRPASIKQSSSVPHRRQSFREEQLGGVNVRSWQRVNKNFTAKSQRYIVVPGRNGGLGALLDSCGYSTEAKNFDRLKRSYHER